MHQCLDVSGHSRTALALEHDKASGQLGPKVEAGCAWPQVGIAPLQTNASASVGHFAGIDCSSHSGLGDVQTSIGAADRNAIQHACDDIKLLHVPIVVGSGVARLRQPSSKASASSVGRPIAARGPLIRIGRSSSTG